MLLIAVSIALSGGRATPTDQVAAGGTTSGTTTGTADGTRVITVRLADLRISPAVVEIAAGTRVFLDVTNADAMAHDLHIDGGPATPMLKPGATARLDLGAMRRTVAGWCTVPGHKAAGMVITIKVTGASHAAVNTSEAS